jgi:hypothetical protein
LIVPSSSSADPEADTSSPLIEAGPGEEALVQMAVTSKRSLLRRADVKSQDDDLPVEVATLEQFLHALQLAYCRPSAGVSGSFG